MDGKDPLLDLTLRQLLEHKIRIIRIMTEALYKEIMEWDRKKEQFAITVNGSSKLFYL